VGPILTTTILATYTDPIVKVTSGKSIIVGSAPSTTAFNVVFAIGIALSIVCIALSIAIKNGAFKNRTKG
jgi:hypothetical protein